MKDDDDDDDDQCVILPVYMFGHFCVGVCMLLFDMDHLSLCLSVCMCVCVCSVVVLFCLVLFYGLLPDSNKDLLITLAIGFYNSLYYRTSYKP